MSAVLEGTRGYCSPSASGESEAVGGIRTQPGPSPEEIVEIQAGKAEIARGERVDWDDPKRELDLSAEAIC